jgi:hypothetical protein
MFSSARTFESWTVSWDADWRQIFLLFPSFPDIPIFSPFVNFFSFSVHFATYRFVPEGGGWTPHVDSLSELISPVEYMN